MSLTANSPIPPSQLPFCTQNEEEIGDAVRKAIDSGLIEREDVFISSKISPYELGTEKATSACNAVIERLGLGYVDLMLIHWPGVAKTDLSSPINSLRRLETWRVLELFHAKGLARSIGVSNYEISHLKELLAVAKINPACNQVECHPLYPQQSLRSFCGEHNIGLVAYSPFAAGAFFNDSELSIPVEAIAKQCGKTPAQVLCCWGLQKGCSAVLPKSIHPDRIREVSQVAPGMQWDSSSGRWLPEEIEQALDALGKVPKKFCWDPSTVT